MKTAVHWNTRSIWVPALVDTEVRQYAKWRDSVILPPRCYHWSMGYRVQIRPFILTEGEFKGHMEFIHFHVFLGDVEVGRWSETNIGQLPDSLGKLVGRAKAIEYDRILRTNIEVDVPGEYTEEQLRLLHTPHRGE